MLQRSTLTDEATATSHRLDLPESRVRLSDEKRLQWRLCLKAAATACLAYTKTIELLEKELEARSTAQNAAILARQMTDVANLVTKLALQYAGTMNCDKFSCTRLYASVVSPPISLHTFLQVIFPGQNLPAAPDTTRDKVSKAKKTKFAILGKTKTSDNLNQNIHTPAMKKIKSAIALGDTSTNLKRAGDKKRREMTGALRSPSPLLSKQDAESVQQKYHSAGSGGGRKFSMRMTRSSGSSTSTTPSLTSSLK